MNKYLISLVVVVIILVGVYYLLFTNPEQQPSVTATSTAETIKMGFMFPLSGDSAAATESVLAGAQLAVKEVNDAGGVNGRQLEVFVEDDQCSKEGGVAAMTRLIINSRVNAVIGSLCAAATMAANAVAQAAGVPFLAVGTAAPGVTNAGDFIFRLYPTEKEEALFTANYITTVLQKKKVAIVYAKNEQGQFLAETAANRLKEAGVTVVFMEGLAEDAKDLKVMINKIKSSKAEVVYLPTTMEAGLIVLQKIAEAKIKTVVVGNSLWDRADLPNNKEAEGVFLAVPNIPDQEVFQEKIKDATGKDNHLATAFAFDAVKLLAEIIRKTGTDKKSIRNALITAYYDRGVSAPVIEFNDQRELKEVLLKMKTVREGKLVFVGETANVGQNNQTAATSTPTSTNP